MARMLLLVVACFANCQLRAEESWTHFRGPTGDGISRSIAGPTVWSEQDNIRWKTATPGEGWSSPVCDGKFAWMTTAIVTSMSDEEQDRIREADYAEHAVGAALVFVKEVEFRAIGVDLHTGELVHDKKLFSVSEPNPIHSLNSYASPTPVFADGKLFCHFGSFGTVCLDTASLGKTDEPILWCARLEHDESVGPGSSPTLYKDLLLIPCDGVDKQFVVGLDTADGTERWRTNRPKMQGSIGEYHKAFSTPVIIQHQGKDQAVVLGAQWLVSYDPATGKELWRVQHGKGFSSSVVPVYGDGLVFVCTGFGDGKLIAVDVSGLGDVTETHMKWSFAQKAPTMPSPILANGYLFMVSDQGIATCLDAKSGSSVWRNRLGGNFSSSPILIGSNVYFSNREGQTNLIAAANKFQSVAENELNGTIMASPIVVGNDLLVRTNSHLYRIEAGKQGK